MRVYADLHIHSYYSGATSRSMNLEEIARYATIKGLGLLGTGDALHPGWFKELSERLEEIEDTGIYRLKLSESPVYFVFQTEVATVHYYKEKARRIHHVILMPSKDVSAQIADRLSTYGDLASDGRPVLTMTPAELVDIVLETENKCLIFPAHAWTPWWSVFGSFSGVDSLEEAYEDRSKDICALETGLSSDPLMNWRVSSLDRLTLISASDAHSPYPFRLGREAVVFELDKLTYEEITNAIRKKDSKKIIMTVEVPPAYGKYHWSGHRNCNVGPIPPEDAKNIGYKCTVCGKKLTKGVEDRVNELADRPPGYVPENSISFRYAIPLQELIAVSEGVDLESEHKLMSGRIWKEYARIVSILGDELRIMFETSEEELKNAMEPQLVNLIMAVRQNRIKIIPGFDGVYGRIIFGTEEKVEERKSVSKRLEDFF
ncbi:MAG: endonuclease Q family protein [Nitrososphaerota archaeon]|nr:endonuclease Q family protein [Aigarchaeota archaeon]MDW8076227.1 endonuclease Q family protein [Nitrososphaerota archaeon]